MSQSPMMLVPYVDADNKTHWLEVSAEIAEALAAIDPPLREHLVKKPEGLERVAEEDRSGGELFGVRLAFRLLLGSSATWKGGAGLICAREDPETGLWAWECSICRGAKLPSYAYCLGCDRCGRELAIGQATEAEKSESVATEVDGLKGGLEGKR
jgi:hypothetical protein